MPGVCIGVGGDCRADECNCQSREAANRTALGIKIYRVPIGASRPNGVVVNQHTANPATDVKIARNKRCSGSAAVMIGCSFHMQKALGSTALRLALLLNIWASELTPPF
jgi:hypothetical protein